MEQESEMVQESERMNCPYSTGKVWCNSRESDNDSTFACDSCYVLWGDCWEIKKEGNDEVAIERL